MVSLCEGNTGDFYFLDLAYPYYVSLSVVNMVAFIMKRDSRGGVPSRRMRSVTVHVGGDSTEGCRQSVCPSA